MSVGAWVLIAAVVGATSFGLWRAATDGRLRGTHEIRRRLRSERSERHETTGADADVAGRVPPGIAGRVPPQAVYRDPPPWADQLGERATLVQFSSAFCAPCRTTRHVLAGVADAVPGVSHVEIDAEHHLELVRELGIMRTPTTLILDADGVERLRASGVPKRDQVIAAL